MSVLSLFLKLQEKLGSRGKGIFLSAVMFHCACELPNLSLMDYFYEMASEMAGRHACHHSRSPGAAAVVPIKQWGSLFSRSES